MAREILNAAVVQQFKRYLKKKGKDFDKLTKEEVKSEGINFLKDMYPGAEKPPHNYIELMASPATGRTMKSTGFLFPNELEICGDSNKKRKKRSLTCPDSSWYQNVLGDCLKVGPEEKTKYHADNYCEKTLQREENRDDITLINFYDDLTIPALYNDLDGQKIPGLNSDDEFWIHAYYLDKKENFLHLDKLPKKLVYNADSSKYFTQDPMDNPDFDKSNTHQLVAQLQKNTGKLALLPKNHAHKLIRKVLCWIKNPSRPSLEAFPKSLSGKLSYCFGTEESCKQTERPPNPLTTLPKYPCSNISRKKRSSSDEDTKRESKTDTPQNIQKLNLLLDPSKAEERQENYKKMRNQYKEDHGNMNLTTVYESLFEILWYSQMPCFDVKDVTSNAKDEMSMMKKCFWKGIEMPCPAIFKTLPTDRGMCCTFNMENAENIFQESSYTKLVQSMQTLDESNRSDR